MSTIKDEAERVYMGGLTLGDLARPLFINKAAESAYEIAKMSYRSAVILYKESGSRKHYDEMVVARARFNEVAGDVDLRFAMLAARSAASTAREEKA